MGDGPSAMRWTVSVEPFANLTELDWARVSSGTSLYGTPAWLLAGEPHRSFVASPLVARDGHGDVCGLLPAWWYSGVGSPAYDYARVFGWGTVASRHDAPVLVLGSRSGYSSHVLASEPDVAVELLRAADELGREGGGWCLLYGDRRTATTLEAALGTSRPQRLLCGAETSIAASNGLEGYLAGLTSKRRRSVRAEIRAFAESGFRVRREAPCRTPEYAAMLVQNQERHGHAGALDRAERYLSGQAEQFGDQALLWVCDSGGTAVGFLFAVRHGDVLYVRTVGFDYPRLQGRFEYFNLTFYTPLAAAPDLDVRELRFGLGGYPAKVGRGARLDPRFAWVRLTAAADDAAWRRHAQAWASRAVDTVFEGLDERVVGDLLPDLAEVRP